MKTVDELMSLNYDMVIQRVTDEGEEYFSVSYPELSGLVIYADTIDEGIKELEEAKLEWFYAALESDVEIPEPKKSVTASGRVTLRLPKSLHSEIKERAKIEDISLNSYLNYLISTGLRVKDIENVGTRITERFTKYCRVFFSKILHTTRSTENAVSKLLDHDIKKEEFHFHFEMNESNDWSVIDDRNLKGLFLSKQDISSDDKVIKFEAKQA